jgi:hypothetical protein
MAAFMPGESPPDVSTPILLTFLSIRVLISSQNHQNDF